MRQIFEYLSFMHYFVIFYSEVNNVLLDNYARPIDQVAV